MSTPDDDLHGRQLVLLLLFFAVVGGGLYILRWPNFLSGNPIACAAIAGAACYPARFLVERFEWWKRLAQPTRRTIARRERTHQRAVTREAAERRLPQDRTGGAEHRRPVRGRPRWFSSARRLIGGKSHNKPE